MTLIAIIAAIAWVFLGGWAAGHAVMHKRDGRAATAWALCAFTLPFVGAALYVLLGMNRIKRRATRLREGMRRKVAEAPRLAPPQFHLQPLAALVDAVADRGLLPGNRIEVLESGDQAYPRMLEAIRGAERSVALMSYIFDGDDVGIEFADALAEANERGVQVRVLVDDAGARYHRPSIDKLLQARGVVVARFMPALPTLLPYFNLRNHRKVMVVDGRRGFTGGMNIRAACVLASNPREPVQDVHFELTGPVVQQLSEVFWEDWHFTAGEELPADPWFPDNPACGDALGRVIAEGPDEDFERIRWALLGAVACARSSIQITTPYFLPDPTIITALTIASLRGVQVDIVVPSKSNLPLLDSAMSSHLLHVSSGGCHVYASPPPFDHSKLMVVDRAWTFLGSTNWDARSLRLNFEVNVEVYDEALADQVSKLIEAKILAARVVSPASLWSRSWPIRLRDGVTRLLAPYL